MALTGVDLLVKPGPVYRQHLGVEVYGSRNSLVGAVYYNPRRDWSTSLLSRSEWVLVARPDHRFSLNLLATAGLYGEEGFDTGWIGGLWLEAVADLDARTALVVGAGARSQLYDGNRERDPRYYVTIRRRL